jgi:DNA gyrase subunit B/topoisomerase-4 subunit B
VNGIPTSSGGTHESGLRAGLGKAVRNFIETHALSPKGVSIIAEDIREGLVGVLSLFIQEPQFQGQTKDRLNNPEMMSAVDGVVRPALEHWLNHNISVAEAIVARIILSARAREASRAAQAEVSRKSATSGRLNLPGERGQRDLHCRGRFGGRVGEAGARPRTTGDSPAARQGLEH